MDDSLPPPPRRAAQVGDRIALRYQLTSVLGAGALGRVFRGVDEETNGFVAIKVLHENARTPQNDERFMREARLLTDLDAPGVVDVFDYGIDSGAPFLVMEIVKGSSLSDVIAEGELTISEAVRIAGEVLDALVPVHERGFVHRDIKPGNVMLREDRSVCLLDFGMSRRATGTGRVTQAGARVGSPAYMPPEQILDDDIDARSDLYAVGAVLYETLTGVCPFEWGRGEKLVTYYDRVLSEEPDPPSLWRSEIPEALTSLVLRALSKEREGRYASAMEMKRAMLAAT